MTTNLRALIDAYADAFSTHEESVFHFAQAELLHGGPRQRRNSDHRGALETAAARYRETSRALLAARGEILAALEST